MKIPRSSTAQELSATLAIVALVATPSPAQQLDLSALPVLDGPAIEADWLVQRIERGAAAYRSADRSLLVLDNGLVRRAWRVDPNGACVAFNNLMTGESMLRAVRPEARVELDGVRYEVGGLVGQPNHAFLTPAWLEELEAAPGALQLVGFQVGETAERFPWKRVRHSAPDVAWPPPGVALRLDFALPELDGEALERLLDSDKARTPAEGKDGEVPRPAPPSERGRKRLLFDDFGTLDAAWRVHASRADARSSFENEGKVGEIYTPANTSVYAERDLPEGTHLVEATIDAGTDRSASWGPGIALLFGDRAVKFHLRPGGGGYDGAARFGLWNGEAERDRLGGRTKLSLEKPWTLRLRVTRDALFCDARRQGAEWHNYARVERESDWGAPTAVRIGKLDRQGGHTDFGEPGELVRSRVIDFAAWSGLDEESLAGLRAQYDELRKIRVAVNYELYDGVPVLAKWITVHNGTPRPVTLDRFASEILAVVEHASWVEAREGVAQAHPQVLHVETDFAFGGMVADNANRHVVHWRTDPQYSTQVSYLRQNPCLLEVEPTYGPAQTIEPGGTFESQATFELVHDSTDRERRGLARRRMYRTIAPWVTENPLMMHMRTADPEQVRGAIEQCVEVGFEMLILSFGSGFNIEDESEENLARWREMAEYAHSRGIEIGGYSLLSSRRIGGGNDVVSPEGSRPTHGNCPAVTSEWGQNYYRKLYQFFEQTGFDLLEHDGPYPGDVDITPRPPLQKGEADSRWVQWRIASGFYEWCRGQGIYLNAPDYYYLSGSTKCGMGYREVNWSLPRAQQVIHTRQNIYDGTWQKTPSMGWMFVPLTQYHGGGAAATIEPLDAHLDHYGRMMDSNLALGVQACYRGPRLYDTDRTREMVRERVEWFKAHRDILESDLVHGRRADGHGLDWMLHVNPRLEEKGLLVVFNPLEEERSETLTVNLYYTGLMDVARVHQGSSPAMELPLARDYTIQLDCTVPAGGMTWFVFEE